MKSISCIIPAYNEAERIIPVIMTALKVASIDQVIVVNDGSKDNTESVLKNIPGIELITYSKNRGKSHAVMLGFKAAKNDIVLMLDADLLDLNPENINSLTEPVLLDKADISMSLRGNSLLFYKIMGLDFVSGERCFNKNIIQNLDELDTIPGYGLELFLNQIYIDRKMRLNVATWNNVKITNKSAKIGKSAGLKGEFRMVKELISYLGIIRITKIYFKMLSLKIKTD
jgi:glycosyltransferase involved in cell wall biosynthesis